MTEPKINIKELEHRYAVEKRDCFAWYKDHYCDALKVMDCEFCSFYKAREQIRKK